MTRRHEDEDEDYRPERRRGTPAWAVVLIVLGCVILLCGGGAVVAAVVGGAVFFAGAQQSNPPARLPGPLTEVPDVTAEGGGPAGAKKVWEYETINTKVRGMTTEEVIQLLGPPDETLGKPDDPAAVFGSLVYQRRMKNPTGDLRPLAVVFSFGKASGVER